MKNTVDSLLQAAATVADSAMKATAELTEKGKRRIDQGVLQNRLGKLQKQLGALVYTLQKSGESNQPMIEHYVAEIDRVKELLAEYGEPDLEKEDPVCTCTEVKEDAVFCGCDGDELPEI